MGVIKVPCEDCGGTGILWSDCPACEGTGAAVRTQEVDDEFGQTHEETVPVECDQCTQGKVPYDCPRCEGGEHPDPYGREWPTSGPVP
jgi:RecJ-like exonuclease